MNRLSFAPLYVLFFLVSLKSNAQSNATHPPLDSSYTENQIEQLVTKSLQEKTDTVGLIYAYGISIIDEKATTSQRTEALYYFIEHKGFTKLIPLKDALRIKIAILGNYSGAEKSILAEKLKEVDGIISVSRKNKWDILCVKAYLLKYYLQSEENYDTPYPEELIEIYEVFKPALVNAEFLNIQVMLMVGRYYQQEGVYEKAIFYFDSTRELAKKWKDPYAYNFSTLFLAQSHRLNNEVSKAKFYAHEVLRHCEKSDQLRDIDFSRWASEELGHVYKSEGNFKKSAFYWELYDAKIKVYRQKSGLQSNIEPTFIQRVENDLTERKEKEELQQKLVKQTKRNNTLLIITLVVTFFMAATLLVLGVKLYEQRSKRLLKESEVAIAASREEERETIARELHDHVGNTLIAVKNAIPKSVKNYLKITDAINEIYAVIRRSSHALSTSGLTTVGLAESCKDYIQLIDNEKIIKMSVVGDEKNISLNLSKEAFRITQELIQNTLKYSHASEINFALLINPDSLILNFEDDGIGFENSSTNSGIGLKNIKERVKRLAGDITIDTSHTYGSSFWISLPIKD